MGFRYIGSKARIADEILRYIEKPKVEDGYFIDAFSGTGIIASKAADCGWKVVINDMMLNAAIVSESHLIAEEDVPFAKFGGYNATVELLNNAEEEGYIWKEYSPASQMWIGFERKYFTESNARKIDGANKLIHKWKAEKLINQTEFSLLIASLISAVNEVANTAGTYGCFLANWTAQSQNDLKILALPLRKQKVEYMVSTLDVFNVRSNVNDLVYLDPPYTKRQYAAYYHVLETIAYNDEPVVTGITGLRPWRDNASVFCYKTKALKALTNLVVKQSAKRVIVSYSNDGHIQLEELVSELERNGSVNVIELGVIGRYRPNITASQNKSDVKEYLIDYRKQEGNK